MPGMGRARTLVLVHGAWHGGWCWERVLGRLEAAGAATVVVDNPSVAAAPCDLRADVDNVRRVLDQVEGGVTLVGHSYGGAVITDATHDRVERLVYVSAFALDAGESVIANDLAGGEDMQLGDAITFDGDLARFDPGRATEFFFHDCAPDIAADATARLRPQSLPAMAGTVEHVAWRVTPASYIMCTDDRALPVALQQSNAARVGNTFELATSHSPFLSQPAVLADLLLELNSR
jgi:pimeloyl-ACP methyl ester carboxylesterase